MLKSNGVKLKPSKCHYCGKFLSRREWWENWDVIQNPNSGDPDPLEIVFCNQCKEMVDNRKQGWMTP